MVDLPEAYGPTKAKRLFAIISSPKLGVKYMRPRSASTAANLFYYKLGQIPSVYEKFVTTFSRKTKARANSERPRFRRHIIPPLSHINMQQLLP